MNLNIWHLKNDENGSLKLNVSNLPEGITISEIQFNNWYQINTQTEPNNIAN
ncbi:hypothetical protein NWE61_00985 [Mycoplasmopsis felis]|nr:hypothetical protein [Mycoplasmopsis felis]MCU9933799.1 hypothetical protein [Mycoplasmopsis felis]